MKLVIEDSETGPLSEKSKGCYADGTTDTGCFLFLKIFRFCY